MTTKHCKVRTYCEEFPPIKSHTPLLNLYAHNTFQGGAITLGTPTHAPIHKFFLLVTLFRVGFFIRNLLYGNQFSPTWNLGSLFALC